MNNNEIQAKKYLEWLNRNYDAIKDKLMSFCHNKNYEWDEDIFCDTYMKIYEKIIKSGIKDDSKKGFDNYTFMSFKINTVRSKQYARNYKRDGNVLDVGEKYEEWFNATKLSPTEKLKSDIYIDFATLYLMLKVEENWDSEHFNLFKVKMLEKLTYKELAEKTGIKGVRNKVIEVKNWLKENVSRDEIKKALEQEYGELFN